MFSRECIHRKYYFNKKILIDTANTLPEIFCDCRNVSIAIFIYYSVIISLYPNLQ